jgi:hypothetical protein
MTIWSFVTIGAAVAVVSWPRETPGDGQYEVRVCLEASSHTEAFRAEGTASGIYSRIGVKLDWRRDPQSYAPPNQGITITLSEGTEPTFHPGALAYAMPYQKRTIGVLFDRVKAAAVPPLLTYVLVHEIAHMLSGTDEHAAEGIMKSHWDEGDYAEMRRGRLTFTPRDVLLIQNGLKTEPMRRSHCRARKSGGSTGTSAEILDEHEV